MLVPVVVELMQQHLKLSSWLKPWVNLNLPWAEPSAIGLVLAEFATFDFGEAWHGQ